MVWGMVEPIRFGDYFPNGDYVGWDERLEKYQREEMAPEQREIYKDVRESYPYDVSRKFIEESERLAPHECPTEFRIEKTPKDLASLLQLNSRLLAVDESLMHLIEEFEPNTHQFWPIKISLPKGREYPKSYYGMVIRQFLDSFVPEQSTEFDSKYAPHQYRANNDSKACFAKLAVSKRVIGSAQLWRERKLRTPKLCMSDELQSAIAQRGLRIFKHHKLKVI